MTHLRHFFMNFKQFWSGCFIIAWKSWRNVSVLSRFKSNPDLLPVVKWLYHKRIIFDYNNNSYSRAKIILIEYKYNRLLVSLRSHFKEYVYLWHPNNSLYTASHSWSYAIHEGQCIRFHVKQLSISVLSRHENKCLA